MLKDLIILGFRNFVIPKFSDQFQILQIKSFFEENSIHHNDFKFILLVENPLALCNLHDIVKNKSLNFVGIGFGSHDYCMEMNIKHIKENFQYARDYVLNIAKAFKLEAIDYASMNIQRMDDFAEECLDGFRKGFSAKFIIHPKQLEILNGLSFYDKDEIIEAERVYEHIRLLEEGQIPIICFEGKVYEKPHIKRISQIIKSIKRNGSK